MELRAQMSECDRALRKARKGRDPADWKNFKRLRNQHTDSIRNAKSWYSKDLLSKSLQNPRQFWKVMKELIPMKPKSLMNTVDSLENNENVTATSCKEKANPFCDFFSNVANALKTKSMKLKNIVWAKPPKARVRTKKVFRIKYVSKLFVEKELRKLKRHKATGIDQLLPGLWKDCASEIAAALAQLINISLATSEIPKEWKHAKIIPLFKSGINCKAENYLYNINCFFQSVPRNIAQG